MWKFVARGIRETLERRACRTNVYSQTSQDANTKSEVKTSLTCDQKHQAPSFHACKGFCGSKKTSGTRDKQEDSKWDTNHTWSEAVGWSSILAVGWVVCQTLCLRRRIFDNENKDSLSSRISQLSEARIKYLFGQVLSLEPKHILPVTNCVGNNNKNFIEDHADSQWSTDKPFGPITVEEALKEATDQFTSIHNLVVGEYELHYGIRALEEKRYKDAVKHFTSGAKLSSPASMFNLGLCYELGLGTRVDEAKAVKHYSDAAEQGHADAIYNLGVFYAQGRGGFPVDIDRARSCFIKAAKLGQIQAQHALDLERDLNRSKENISPPLFINTHENSISYVRDNGRNNILSKLIGYSANSGAHLHVEAIAGSSNRSETSGDIRTPTEIFLDFLGLKEPSIVY